MKTFRLHVSTLLVGGVASVVASSCGSAPSEPAADSTSESLSPLTVATDLGAPPSMLPAPRDRLPPRSIRDQIIYYVMPDRFANGDPRNDRGDYAVVGGVDPESPAEIAKHGFDPTSRYYRHGGDIAGLTTKLDYIRALGATSIWTTPVMRNNVIQDIGSGLFAAGYHGYWVTDFVGVDPHLGVSSELSRYVDRAHQEGLKIHLDILINHTAELKGYQQCGNAACGTFVSKSDVPYKDASGQPFDDHDYAYSYTSGATFPSLNLASFPYTPVVTTSEQKSPAWMNDPLLYHNRGNISFDKPESLIYGDLFGLDDLFTLHPMVLGGLIDIYKYWIDTYGIDGYRVDAVRHVEDEFLLQWYPAIFQEALRQGKSDFFLYGEADDRAPAARSHFSTSVGLPSTLDMGFKFAAQAVFGAGEATDTLRALLEQDDYFIDADSNAYYLTTLLGSHDSGRIGAALRTAQPNASDAELFARDRLAHAFLLTARGVPAIYYGDEQGFTGVDANGGTNFESARQDMFPTQTPEYLDESQNHLIGGGVLGGSHFDPRHPMYRTIAALTRLRTQVPELRQGAQIHRYASIDAGGGIYAYSRIMEGRNRECLVVFNTATTEKTARFPTFHPFTRFVSRDAKEVDGDETESARWKAHGSASLISDGDGDVSVSMPPLSFRVFAAERPLPRREAAPSVSIASRDFGMGRFFVGATLGEKDFSKVAFYARYPGTSRFVYLGTDDNEPYRVAVDGQKFANGATIDFKAVVTDSSGNQRQSDVRRVTVENRIGTVSVTYENGNRRSSVFGVFNTGEFVFPAAVPSSGPSFAIAWPAEAEAVTLFFEQPGSSSVPFAFDVPVTITRDQVVANGHIGSAGLDADLFVDDAGTISDSAANFHGAPARVLACNATAASAPVPNLPLFIKGDMNGWANHTDPTDTNYNVLDWQIGSCEFDGTQRFFAPGGPYGFKFADASWLANSNFGGPFDPAFGLASSSTSGNLRLQQLPADTYPRVYDVRFFAFAPVSPSAKPFVFYRFERTNQQ